MAASHWLICPNWTEVRRFTKNTDSKDRFHEYIFIDSGIVTGIYGDKPPLMKTRREEKIDIARRVHYGVLLNHIKVIELKLTDG